MSNLKYPKGSEWRKWDLHVHTPASFHWNAGKNLREMNRAEQDASLQIMLDTINNSDVAVFSIMDYWTFDGYLEFLKYISTNNKQLKKKVFPGMELRIESPTDYRLNIHVILSDELTEQQLIDFKSCLKLRLSKRTLSDESLKELVNHLPDDKVRILGFNRDTMNEKDALLCGSQAAEITKESFDAAISSLPKNCGFILLPYDTSDGIERLDWEKHPLADVEFMKTAHMFETRKQDTIDLFVGKVTPKNSSYIENFQKTIGKPKPPLSGSDAHRFIDYGNYPSNKITWIKADPTFEGLKQLIYEPETRVKIQQEKPEEKTSYNVIDKVQFIYEQDEETFPKEEIHLNPNLNVIIGGKSSGKSLLLYYIARAIDKEQVEEKTMQLTGYDFEKTGNFDFAVHWRDGSKNTLGEDPANKSNHPITYIPQMYINNLADEEGQKNLRELILDILLQNSDFKEKYTKHEKYVQGVKEKLDKNILSLFTIREDVKKEQDEVKKKGNKESILTEIQTLQGEIEKIRLQSGFSPGESKQFVEFKTKKETLEKDKGNLRSLKSLLSEYETGIVEITKSYVAEINAKTTALKNKLKDNPEGMEKLKTQYLNLKKGIEDSELAFKKTNSEHIEQIMADEQKIESTIKNVELAIEPYIKRVNNQNHLKSLEGKIQIQKQLLSSIIAIENNIVELSKQYDELLEKIVNEYNNIAASYKSMTEELQKEDFRQISEDIRLEAGFKFDKETFYKVFTDQFNRRKKLNKVIEGCFNEEDEFIYDTLENHPKRISSIFSCMMKEDTELKLKGTNDFKDLTMKLFGDYFYINYNLIQKNDPFIHMSPGKRGLVLIQLFLHLSNSKHPILIDQPEDNLDNRTIYTELNEFIKYKKIDRQIIIVTHNANLVVLTDAEQVIVANQSGQQASRDNAKFRFEYVTGSLECTFIDKSKNGILFQKGIKEHVCEILEGGKDAFEKREEKYGF